MEHALKRSQDSAGPSDLPYKAGRYDGDIRELTVGRENNRERVKESDTRQVVVFNKDHWVETVD